MQRRLSGLRQSQHGLTVESQRSCIRERIVSNGTSEAFKETLSGRLKRWFRDILNSEFSEYSWRRRSSVFQCDSQLWITYDGTAEHKSESVFLIFFWEMLEKNNKKRQFICLTNLDVSREWLAVATWQCSVCQIETRLMSNIQSVLVAEHCSVSIARTLTKRSRLEFNSLLFTALLFACATPCVCQWPRIVHMLRRRHQGILVNAILVAHYQLATTFTGFAGCASCWMGDAERLTRSLLQSRQHSVPVGNRLVRLAP